MDVENAKFMGRLSDQYYVNAESQQGLIDKRRMPEFRQNIATREWVIVSPGRGNPPLAYKSRRISQQSYDSDCPFCPGNEDRTPGAVLCRPGNVNWAVRVIPNKFSPLKISYSSIDLSSYSFAAASESSGIAEVIIESPEHNKSIAFMRLEEAMAVLNVYRQRYEAISRSDGISLVTIFRNYGPGAGTSIPHPHSQIVGMPIIPGSMRYLLNESIRYKDSHDRCLHCDIIENEQKLKDRMIIESDNFVVFCPFASGSPYETVIYPKRHAASYVSINDSEIEELGWVFRTIMLKIYNSLDDPDYNYMIRSAPVGEETAGYFHWHIQITPRIFDPAGFAIGSGIGVNDVAPEEAARRLREIGTDC